MISVLMEAPEARLREDRPRKMADACAAGRLAVTPEANWLPSLVIVKERDVDDPRITSPKLIAVGPESTTAAVGSPEDPEEPDDDEGEDSDEDDSSLLLEDVAGGLDTVTAVLVADVRKPLVADSWMDPAFA